MFLEKKRVVSQLQQIGRNLEIKKPEPIIYTIESETTNLSEIQKTYIISKITDSVSLSVFMRHNEKSKKIHPWCLLLNQYSALRHDSLHLKNQKIRTHYS